METISKKIGLWIDHKLAHFIDISKGPAIQETVYSDLESHTRYSGEEANGTKLGGYRSSNNEHHMHNREQEIMEAYYKILIDRLMDYDNIYLFGPSTAKEELFNKIQADKRYLKKTIHIKAAGQMTEKQLVGAVRRFFNL